MKRLLLLSVMFVQTTGICFAQAGKINSWNLGIGADFMTPDANVLRQTHRSGGGLSIKGEYVFANHASFTLATSYAVLQGKNNNETLRVLPFKAGLRYYFGNFYLFGEGGIAKLGGFKKASAAAYSVGVGDEIFVGQHNNSLDISIRHEAWQYDGITRSVAALRIAYEFRIR